MNRHFTKLGTKYIKKPQPVSEEMQFKTTIRYHFMLIRLANMKKSITLNIGKEGKVCGPTG